MKKVIGILVFALIGSMAMAQSSTTGSISGTVRISTDEPVAYAAISIFDADQALITGSITDDRGRFSLDEIPLGDHTMEIEYLGYEKMSRPVKITADQRRLKLGNILLQVTSTQLDEVTVTAEKSTYTTQLDKKTFNVGRDLISQGGSALDVLDQVPQVTVQPDGAIELRGSSAVQILVNGRRSGLTRDNALEQLQVQNIDRIEVITNPSARYEASGSAGIINIILKKSKGEGLKGQIDAYAGAPANHMLIPSLSYKSDKLELFGSYRWRYSDYNGRYTVDQTFANADYINKRENESRHDDGRSIYAGLDYRPSDLASITLAYYRADTKDTDSTYLDYDVRQQEVISDIARIGHSVENRDYNQLEMSYIQHFGPKKIKWQTDVQYDFWNSQKNWDLNTTGSLGALSVPAALRTDNRSESDDIVINSDLEIPISGAKIRTGLKLDNRSIENAYIAEQRQDGIWSTFNDLENGVSYGEQISAAYLEYSAKAGKISYNIGLRAENSDISLTDRSGELNGDKQYFNVFPSAFLSYEPSEAVGLQVSASRRINRPSLWSLYPFFELKDINILQVGNLDLNPSYTNAYEASMSYTHGILSLNPGIYYRHTTDPDETYIYQDDNGYTIFQPVNIERINEAGVELSARVRPHKAISLSFDLNYFGFDQVGSYEGQNMDASGSAFRLRSRANARLPKRLQISVSHQYRGPQQSALIRYGASTDLSMSISKSFYDDQLRISLQGRNLLDTNNRIGTAKTTTSEIYQKGRRYGPRFMLGATYRFNMARRDRVRQENRGNRN